MSELKVYVKPIKTNMFGKMIVGQSYYLKSEADNVIAEKDKEIAEKDKDIAYWREEYDKETQLTDALKDEIESLKASHYAEMVDAGMRERKLKRALYKVCANLAKCKERISNMEAYDASEYLPSIENQFRKKAKRWSEMKSKCRAKRRGTNENL